MNTVPDPAEVIRNLDQMDPPVITADNPAERRWYPRDRGPHRVSE